MADLKAECQRIAEQLANDLELVTPYTEADDALMLSTIRAAMRAALDEARSVGEWIGKDGEVWLSARSIAALRDSLKD